MAELSIPSAGADLKTLSDLAQASGLNYGALRYAAAKHGIGAQVIAGDRRLYDAATRARILAAAAGHRIRTRSLPEVVAR